MQRMKGQGNPVPDGQKNQNYSFQNFTNPLTSSMATASDPYMPPYFMTSPHYQAFGVSDGPWSNGGDHMQTFLGGYGNQMGYESHNAIDGMFSGSSFGSFNPHNFNYGFHSNGDYSAWGGSDVRSGTKQYDDYYARDVYADERVKTLEQGVQGLALSDPKASNCIQKDANDIGDAVTTNGNADKSETSMGLSAPKKNLSWANIASQPAKPQPNRRRDKASMPSIVPGRHMDIGTWEGKNGGPKPVAPPPAPRPAWDAPRGGSRSTTSFSTPPPRSSPQTSQQPSQIQQISHQTSPQAQQHSSQTSSQQAIQQQHPVTILPSGCLRSDLASQAVPTMLNQPPQHLQIPAPVLEDLHLRNEYNPKDFDLNPKNPRFFVIKSYSEDDIHRSIKYEIWCSTEHGNKRLDTAFREREGKGQLYLFFSVNGSGHFCGVAQMMSPVDYNSSSSVWAQDKWKGQFKVKWVYVKDVPNNQLRHIRLENNENKPVTNSRDTQEVPCEKGKQVLRIIHSYQHKTSIFDDFIHYEKRQEESEHRKVVQDDREDRRDYRDHHREYHPKSNYGGGRGGNRGSSHNKGGPRN